MIVDHIALIKANAELANAMIDQLYEIERLRAALRGADAWLRTWADHVGACDGGSQCDCGLTAIRFETSAELGDAK